MRYIFRVVRAGALWTPFAILTLLASPVFAQTPPTPPPSTSSGTSTSGSVASRLFLIGDGGIALGDEHKAGTFSGDVGVRIMSHLQVMGEFGRFTNIIPNSLNQDLSLTSLTLADQIGAPVTITQAAVPVRYGLGLVQVDLMKIGTATPYIEAGLGEARVSSHFSAESSGTSFSSQVLSTVTLPSTGTDRMVAAGAGVTFRVTKRVGAIVGYRYAQIGTSGSKLDTSRVFGGVRFGF
jgi:opacity protein-like surface antigen